MASKLFRAVVGFGIGLGAASAACFGAAEGTTVGGDVSADEKDSSAHVPGKTTSYEDPGQTSETTDASPDVKVAADAGVDAPKDVGVDAFCDAAWPTTKGNPQPPACTDPNGECVDAGHPGYCIAVNDAGACDWSTVTTAPFCVNKEWRCLTGTISWDQCQ